MPQWIKSGSTWYVKHTKTNGSTTPSNNHDLLNRWIYTTVNGVTTWRPIYRYRWALSDWSACSVTCGGGTKTKTFECIREDGSTGITKHKDGTYTGTLVSNNHCTKSGLTTPSGSTIKTSCNTHSCVRTLYAYGNADDRATIWIKTAQWGAATTVINNYKWNSPYNFKAGQVGPVAFSLNVPSGVRYLYVKANAWDTNGTHGGFKLRMCQNYHGATYSMGESWSDCTPTVINTGYSSPRSVFIWFRWDLQTNAVVKYTCTRNSNGTCNAVNWCSSFCGGAESCGCGSEPF